MSVCCFYHFCVNEAKWFTQLEQRHEIFWRNVNYFNVSREFFHLTIRKWLLHQQVAASAKKRAKQNNVKGQFERSLETFKTFNLAIKISPRHHRWKFLTSFIASSNKCQLTHLSSHVHVMISGDFLGHRFTARNMHSPCVSEVTTRSNRFI